LRRRPGSVTWDRGMRRHIREQSSILAWFPAGLLVLYVLIRLIV
jgi:hypothetical protein